MAQSGRLGLCIRVALFSAAALTLQPVLLTAAPSAVAAKLAETYTTDIELSTRDIGAKETTLGDLIADVIRSAGHADAALIPAAAFSDGIVIRPGGFTAPDLLKSLEFKDETIAVVKLTGDQLRAALEHAFYLYPKSNSSFLQFSGLTVTINADAAGDHHILAVKIAGEPLVGNKAYRLAMPITLANGALAYFKYWKKSDLEKDAGKPLTLETAVTAYLSNHRIVSKGEDRLVSKSKP